MSKVEAQSKSILAFDEFEKLPIEKITSLLKEYANFSVSKNSAEVQIRDIAHNLLHGICFLFNDEKLIKSADPKDNKIIKNPVNTKKSFEECPQCTKKSLILQPLPPGSSIYGLKTCHKCQYVKIPKGGT